MHLALQLIHLPHQKWSPWKGGCHKAILKQGTRGKKGLDMLNYTRTGLKFCGDRPLRNDESSPEP